MAQIKDLILKQEFFEAIADVESFLAEKEISDNSLVQSIIFDKEVFSESSEAVEWAEANGFFSDKMIDNELEVIMNQLSDSEFDPETIKSFEVRRGVSLVVGELLYFNSDPIYASLRNESVKLDAGLPSIIEIAKVIKGFHGNFGDVEITKEMLKQFKHNFDENIVGVDISIDVEHDQGLAAGWIRELFLSVDETTLLAVVNWTPKGAILLGNKEFRYYSPEFSENYVHPHTRKKHGPTLLGGALVNRPFLKMAPIVTLKTDENNINEQTEESTMEKDVISLAEYTAVKDANVEAEKKINEIAEQLKQLSEENTAMKAVKVKTEFDAKCDKLFADKKVSKAQLDAMKEGKDLFEIIGLGENMNTEAKGVEGTNDDVVVLSDYEAKLCKNLNLSKEDYVKFSK